MARVVVIGAGAMGLAAAYHAAKAGHQVEVLEAGAEPGGMAAHFDFDGISIERFYHFVCKADRPTFELLDELGLGDKMRWRKTTMGYFSGGKLHRWGDPISLLRYPGVSLLARLRYGLLAFVSTKRERWDALETQSAREWITRWSGKEAYDKLWKPLFDLKFYEYADDVSAAWIWTRVKRIGRSRRSLFEEQLGYIEGGSQTLVDRLVERIEGMGGQIRLSTPAIRVVTGQGQVTGVEASDGFHPADAVISTMPTPLVSALVPDLPDEWKARYEAINNIGVCCLLFKLRKSVTPHFWVNISEPDIAIPGIIEFSNLRPMPNGEAIVFVPYYMPVTNPKFSWDDDRLLDEAFSYVSRLNPAIGPDDVLARKVARLRHAQPVCEPGFAAKLPPVQTPIAGLQIADTCFYYPEDRGIAESVRLAAEMAGRVQP
ncbi:MAG: amine oxidase [Alphaproteobacteria bacterium]|nr:amine oxidase [Alphaproteobacteria bacterium]